MILILSVDSNNGSQGLSFVGLMGGSQPGVTFANQGTFGNIQRQFWLSLPEGQVQLASRNAAE